MDFGRFQYLEQKRQRQAKKNQKVIEIKEIKFRPKVDEHDYQFKRRNIERFLGEGDKVKAVVFFRGREIAHPEIGRRILERLLQELSEVAIAETMPKLEGNQMSTILTQRPGLKRAAPPAPAAAHQAAPAAERLPAEAPHAEQAPAAEEPFREAEPTPVAPAQGGDDTQA
jgi:translation initiation factor IF-3